MLISNEKIQKIRRVIEKYFKSIIFTMSGKNNLSDQEINDLYLHNLIDFDNESLLTNAYEIGKLYSKNPKHKIKLKDFFKKHKGDLFSLTDKEKYALNHISSSVANHLINIKTKVQTNIEQTISNINLDYRNELLKEDVRNIIRRGILERKTINQLATQLRQITKDTYRDWKLVATTEMATAMTLGEADAIVERNPNKNIDEIYVAKLITKDAATCKICKKAYSMPNGDPKVYKLSELQENGTNYGRKNAELLPTITPMHPGCRCNLVQIPNGWGYENGKITFIGPEYNMYLSQKQK